MRDGECHLLTVESGDGPRVGASFEREEEVSHVSIVFCVLWSDAYMESAPSTHCWT